MEVAIGLALGLLVGGAAVWFTLQAKIQAAREKVKADVIAERASIVERLQNKERQNQELKTSLQDANTAIGQYQDEIKAEIAKYFGAEARASRIPELVEQLKEKDEQIQKLQMTNAKLHAKLSEIEIKLKEEKQEAERSSEIIKLIKELSELIKNSLKI